MENAASFGAALICKVLCKTEETATQTFRMIQEDYQEEAMSRAMVFMWRKRFENGREDVEDDNRTGRPSTSRTEENLLNLRELLSTDHRLRYAGTPPFEGSSPPRPSRDKKRLGCSPR